MRPANNKQRGFSLLEMLVAMAILGLALGVLYQAVSGATRNVRTDERYAYGVELARSLLAQYAVVPRSGLVRSGETEGGFLWRVESRPRAAARGAQIPPGALQDIAVEVSWTDGSRSRRVRLDSVVEGEVRD
ncbi:MAG: general secretion pathway protein GspI [Haliea sp.]|nr:general secretion pathway protein GspI [Haliea sp.]MAL94629.1 general secretion pathway protein GspI [Haliea sp.]|tara:strand:+ start:108 stop:503 length:396 start_codon:yes stop_codon:yes gene_type:complete